MKIINSILESTRASSFTRIMLAVGLTLPLAIVTVGCSGGGSTTSQQPALTAEQKEVVRQNDEADKKARALIAEIEPWLVRNSDGTIGLKNGVAGLNAKTVLSSDAREFAEVALQKSNDLVKQEGYIVQGEDFRLVPSGITAQANINGISYYWWGVRFALDSNRTNQLVNHVGYWGNITGAALGSILGRGSEATKAIGAALGAGLGGLPGYILTIYNRRGRGVYIDVRWLPKGVSVSEQPA